MITNLVRDKPEVAVVVRAYVWDYEYLCENIHVGEKKKYIYKFVKISDILDYVFSTVERQTRISVD